MHQRSATLLILPLVAVACGSTCQPAPAPVITRPPEPTGTIVAGPVGAPAPDTPAATAAARADAGHVVAAATPEPAAVLLSTEGDVDGVPGDEQITLRAGGALSAGAASIHVEIEPSPEVYWRQQARLEIVDLGGKRRGVLFAAPTADIEDPPDRYRVYVLDRGSLVPVLDKVIGAYGITRLQFPGDGTASYIEDGWTACDRVAGAKKVVREQVTFRLDAAGKRMIESGREPTRHVQVCDELAACPYVDVLDAGRSRRMGEILRDVRGARAATAQSLDLGGHGAGPITIRISEEKAEVTFLDEVFVEAGGARVHPRGCDVAPSPAYCAADGRPHVLRQGDTLDLVFDAGGHVVLFARGYYVPTPTAATRAVR
ncbi:hypothetical protein [Sorangium cellulosum]|uniref:Secreted protein n=1 Tax=Sorangium cellulosum TaxID=56 RepID=A0A150QW14_SORCE|nr:hypothetical protein [Sorangium cellulosum]KYF72247.1 hypothetical protein BE15_18970 [Sorangium cellulosum]